MESESCVAGGAQERSEGLEAERICCAIAGREPQDMVALWDLRAVPGQKPPWKWGYSSATTRNGILPITGMSLDENLQLLERAQLANTLTAA